MSESTEIPVAEAEAPTHSGGTSSRLVPFGVAVLAAIQLGTALWMVLAPRSFFEQAGPFGVYNRHYLWDAAAFEGGLGVALAAALAWPALRTGALAAVLASTGLHALNHWVDVGKAHAGSNAGIADAVMLTVLTAAIAWLLRAAWKERVA